MYRACRHDPSARRSHHPWSPRSSMRESTAVREPDTTPDGFFGESPTSSCAWPAESPSATPGSDRADKWPARTNPAGSPRWRGAADRTGCSYCQSSRARFEMFTNIVWATDGSEHADRALDYATQLARGEGATLHAVHVVEKLVGTRLAGQNVFLGESEIDAKIQRQTAKLNEGGVPATLHMTAAT